MGRQVRAVPEASALDETPSIGAYLRGQRLLRGIGLSELAAVTRIPERSLERLEAGEFDDQPDGFARGFVRAVATALGLDPDESVARMLAEPEPEAGSAVGLPLHYGLWLGAALSAALVVALVWWWMGGSAEPRVEPDAAPVVRRDPVRDLADDEQAPATLPVPETHAD